MDRDELDDRGNARETPRASRRTIIVMIASALGVLGIGAGGFSWLRRGTPTTGCVASSSGSSSCTQLATELTEGPYYLDVNMVRSDITEGKPGVPLLLRVNVIDATKCTAIENAAVDIWHCDALGIYSGYIAASTAANNSSNQPPQGAQGADPGAPPQGASSGPPPGGGHQGATDKETFLRGIQITDHKGTAEFHTIYPGWYTGRTTHIHLKVHVDGTNTSNAYSGGHVSHTGQFFFSDELSQQIGKLKPYMNNAVVRTSLMQDTIYPAKNTAGSLLTLTPIKSDSLEAGLLGVVTVAVNTSATSGAIGFVSAS